MVVQGPLTTLIHQVTYGYRAWHPKLDIYVVSVLDGTFRVFHAHSATWYPAVTREETLRIVGDYSSSLPQWQLL